MPPNNRKPTIRGGFTPRQVALSITLDALRATYNDPVAISEWAGAKSMQLKIQKQIARLHNRLLDESDLDGLPLDDRLSVSIHRGDQGNQA